MDKNEVIEIARNVADEGTADPFHNDLITLTPDELIRFAAEIEKRTIERCAKRADAYSYMSQNFTALADELRTMGDK